jgi:hypothetical protein
MDQVNKYASSHPTFQAVTSDPKILLYAAAFFSLVVLLLTRLSQLFKKQTPARQNTPDLEKPAARSFKAPPRNPGGEDRTRYLRVYFPRFQY